MDGGPRKKPEPVRENMQSLRTLIHSAIAPLKK